MIRAAIVVAASVVLAGCGGNGASTSRGVASVASLASGPVSAACLRSDRRGASPRVCGCAQSMADRNLSNSDQRLAASFFSDPQRAQDTRQSDRPSNEAFWQRYKLFIADSERYCAAIR